MRTWMFLWLEMLPLVLQRFWIADSCPPLERVGWNWWTCPVSDINQHSGLLVHLPHAESSAQSPSLDDTGFCGCENRTISSTVAWHAREVVNDGIRGNRRVQNRQVPHSSLVHT